ncbi:hypothetical protein [Streptomyces sp. NBC_00624]|uniref:hypothetical protein n=1 Tax=Streptomyces sp. NBC_00624 TaxID=2975791 RepID=UPI0030E2013F
MARAISLGPFSSGVELGHPANVPLVPAIPFSCGPHAQRGHRRTHFCFAQVAVAAVLTVHDGVISEARIGLVNCADRPLRAHAAEQALTGVEIGPPMDGYQLREDHPFTRAGRIAAERDAAHPAEPYADLEYRRHAIAVVVARTLCQAANDHRSRIDETKGDSQ